MTQGWPPFFAAFFALSIACILDAVIATLVVNSLGGVPDDPLLAGPVITLSFGMVAGAIGMSVLFAPSVFVVRNNAMPRPWSDMTQLAVIGAMTAGLFAPLKEFAPNATLLACGLSAICGAIAGGLYWLLVGRPRPPYQSGDETL